VGGRTRINTMPLVKIELVEGKFPAFLNQLQTIVMDCVQEVLKLPTNDRNVRLLQYKPGFFTMKPPYEILIEITMFSGRSKGIKKLLYQQIVNRLNDVLNVNKESVFILINEQTLENWGVRGGIPADEVNLGFKVSL
jgi:phenylpyruvate tautomerase PptA (4-oxalocrotonate tautomerase family)